MSITNGGALACGASLLRPLFCFLRLLPGPMKLHDPLVRALEMIPVGNGDSLLPRQHPAIAIRQQRFRVSIFLVPSQALTQQALGAESLPVVGLLLAIKLKRFARQR